MNTIPRISLIARRAVSQTPFLLAATLALCFLTACQAPAGPASQANGGEQATTEVAAAPRTEPAQEPESYTNKVRWATASESDNFGYHVYRGDTEDGEFEQLTDDPIPGAGNTDETNRYEFVDDTIDPHRGYFYYVESVSMDGEQTRFTPIIRAKAKLPSDDVESGGEEDGESPEKSDGEGDAEPESP